MRIASVQIKNYKSFLGSPQIELLPGINVVVGENNTGKTSLIEALAMRFANQPHRSSETYRGAYTRPPAQSKVIIRFEISREELLEALAAISPFSVVHPVGSDATTWLSIPKVAILRCDFGGGERDPGRPNMVVPAIRVAARLEHVPEINPNIGAQAALMTAVGGVIRPAPPDVSENIQPKQYQDGLAEFAVRSIYAFKAERYNLGTSPAGNNAILLPDASNLAEVLSVLQKHPTQWNQFRNYVRAVFPNIYGLSVGPAQPNVVEIQIWNEPPEGLPKEVAVPVSESGTGIGQVLAILAVVVMADFPRTIIIDEPQSFLHPGALRTMVEILGEHPQHQFVIATHSPIVITATVPAQILKTVRNKAVTFVQNVDLKKNDDIRAFLRDVGARLSDVFGVERILWVDGATEEACFPEIIAALVRPRRFGTKILGVLHTGDFDRSDAKTVIRTYRKLSGGEGLLPTAVGFLFDRETRSPGEIEDLRRMGSGTVDFLDHRMFENYLLDPDAIATVMNECEGFRAAPVQAEEVSGWIDARSRDPEFGPTDEKESNESLLMNVHAARLLARLFSEFSDSRCSYRKIVHGLRLTQLLLVTSPERFSSLVQKITALETASQRTET